MRVLFVSSGNSSGGITPVVHNQGESLRKEGVELEYFTIRGKGMAGYFNSLRKLVSLPGLEKFDIIHAHYSLSGIISGFAMLFAGRNKKTKIIVSLMGSDVTSAGAIMKSVIRLFHRFLWNKTVVKSREMKEILGLEDVEVIPNGVDIDLFKPLKKEEARQLIGIEKDSPFVIFLADPSRPEKNFELARMAVNKLNLQGNILKAVYNVPPGDIPYYLNAADLLLLTSLWEGSVNVVKEAMACNCPIVATSAGDVEWVTGGTEGTFITDGSVENTASKVEEAISFAVTENRTRGRERIVDLGLDSKTISGRITSLYSSVL